MQASVGQIRTVETTIVVDAVVIVKVVSTIKAIEVPASTNVSAEASVDVALKAATYVVAETATHMTASAAACLGVRRKQAAGQHGARQDHHRSPLHDIILSVELYFRAVGSVSSWIEDRVPASLDGTGHAISATQPAPTFSVSRKPCNLTMAETRLRPRPVPGVFRLLSDL
jgi:hypothetical protein